MCIITWPFSTDTMTLNINNLARRLHRLIQASGTTGGVATVTSFCLNDSSTKYAFVSYLIFPFFFAGGSPHTMTGDTDFIIGDRVYVGNKPGIIAYLGDVKFANGDFAGVVLGMCYDVIVDSVKWSQYSDSAMDGFVAVPYIMRYILIT